MPLTKIDDRGLTTPIDLQDSEKLRFGIGNDLEIYHNGSNTYLKNSTGWLNILSDTVFLGNSADTKAYLKAVNDGSVELYYNHAKKLETTSSGATLTGDLTVTGTFPKILLTDADHNPDYSIINANGEFKIFSETDSVSRIKVKPDGTVEVLNDLQIPNDTGKIELGTSQDLKIFHDGTDSYLQNATGDLYIQTTGSGDDIFISAIDDVQINVGGETAAKFIADGTVELYNNNVNTFKTDSNGIIVKGPEGDYAAIFLYADEGDDDADKWALFTPASGGFKIQNFASGGWENNIIANGNGAVELYHDNIKRFETTNEGNKAHNLFRVSGASGEDGKIIIQADNAATFNDYVMLKKEDGTGFYIQNIANQSSWETNLKTVNNGAVELYYDNSKKLETTSYGTLTAGESRADNFQVLDYDGSSTGLMKIGAGDDLKIYHDGSNTKFKNTTGRIHIENSADVIRTQTDSGFFMMSNDGNTVHAEVDSDGLKFNGDTAAANALDDYEEGTWTPTLNEGNNAVSLTYAQARYVKIGAMVYAFWRVDLASTSAGGHLIMSGLPFNNTSTEPATGGTAKDYQNYDIENGPIYHLPNGQSNLQFYKNEGNNFAASNGSGKSFRGCTIYSVA